jgi:DNA repair protein RecN (Recombination protein N)
LTIVGGFCCAKTIEVKTLLRTLPYEGAAMLRELFVENFALIERVTLSLASGFNCLSGETGAGKSLIVDAVSLLLGGRGKEHLIRSGEDKCLVEGFFLPPFPPELLLLLADTGLDAKAEELILSREYSRAGRSICRINGRTVNLNLLRQAGCLLVNIHGQKEYALLLQEEQQLHLLDSFGGSELLALRHEVAASWLRICRGREESQKHNRLQEESRRRLDWLRFELEEIDAARLQTDEEVILAEERQVLLNSEHLQEESARLNQALTNNQNLQAAYQSFRRLIALDPGTTALAERFNSLYYELEDINREISHYLENITNNPRRLEEIEQRLALINQLRRKYGPTIPAILAYAEKAARELEELLNRDQSHEEALAALLAEEANYQELAAKLSSCRRETSQKLSQAITTELKQLYLPHALLEVSLIPCEAGRQGLEKALFLIQANPGEPAQPVSKVASGGELSRIVLAIKVILAQLDQVPTLIFDEIDSGLGGRALSATARRLQLIAGYTQVLCVSHAPLIAAAATNHLSIYKEVQGGRSLVGTKRLEGELRLQELARMIAGEQITEATLAQAADLLKGEK